MYVGMPAPQEKRAIAEGLTAKGMAGRVSRRVSFCLHDAPAYPALGEIVHQRFANQKLRESQRSYGKLTSAQAPHAKASRAVSARLFG